uniref:S-adenosyl-L-homocysteine hydrolase NAD binding domain-containing protein n=1 Tax=Alexandrium monilatum TaxID=311494 RepID=A0A7S4RTS1_9DINO
MAQGTSPWDSTGRGCQVPGFSFSSSLSAQPICPLHVGIEGFQVGTMESVVGEIDLLTSATGNKDIATIGNMKKMKNSAIVESLCLSSCPSSLPATSICAPRVCTGGFQVVTMESVVGEIGLLTSAAGSKDIFTIDYTKKMKHHAIVEHLGHFGNGGDTGGLETSRHQV